MMNFQRCAFQEVKLVVNVFCFFRYPYSELELMKLWDLREEMRMKEKMNGLTKNGIGVILMLCDQNSLAKKIECGYLRKMTLRLESSPQLATVPHCAYCTSLWSIAKLVLGRLEPFWGWRTSKPMILVTNDLVAGNWGDLGGILSHLELKWPWQVTSICIPVESKFPKGVKLKKTIPTDTLVYEQTAPPVDRNWHLMLKNTVFDWAVCLQLHTQFFARSYLWHELKRIRQDELTFWFNSKRIPIQVDQLVPISFGSTQISDIA